MPFFGIKARHKEQEGAIVGNVELLVYVDRGGGGRRRHDAQR